MVHDPRTVPDDLTLVSALARLPRGDARGARFIGRDREERYFPFEKLEAEAHRRAAHLSALGMKQGERLAIVVAEPHEFVLTFLGAAMAGIIPVPIYPRANFKNAGAYIEVLAHVISTSGATRAMCMEGNRAVVEQIAAHGINIPIQNVEHAFDGETPEFTTPDIKADDICFLQFTSGSTSKPKGVIVTHRNLAQNASAFLGEHGLDRRDEDVAVSWLPLFHDMGLIGYVLGPIICDIQTVLMPTELFARSPRLWLDTVTKHRGSILFAPNFAYELVTKRIKEKHLGELDLSCVRVAGSGAEPIRAKTLRGFADKFGKCGFNVDSFLPSYGMAESTLAITFHRLGTPMQVDKVDAVAMQDGVAKPADDTTETALEVMGCGRGFPKHEVAIVDDAGNPLPERRVGNVVAKGPSITSGYFENEEATAAALKDGWLQTGDLGYFADETLYICGRSKDLIIIRGANHYPQDIEWAVCDIEGVRRGNVFAFSVMTDDGEQLVVAAEANRSEAERLKTEISRVINAEFGLIPNDVVILPVGTLPKTSSGKAQRRRCKQMYESGQLKPAS